MLPSKDIKIKSGNKVIRLLQPDCGSAPALGNSAVVLSSLSKQYTTFIMLQNITFRTMDAESGLDRRLLRVLVAVNKEKFSLCQFWEALLRSENHQICIRRGLSFKDNGFVQIIQAMLHHKPYGPGKRITRQTRQVMSEQLGPLLCELVGELVVFETDALSRDPRSAKPPADVTGEDAQSFAFIAYHELYKD